MTVELGWLHFSKKPGRRLRRQRVKSESQEYPWFTINKHKLMDREWRERSGYPPLTCDDQWADHKPRTNIQRIHRV